MSRSVLIAIGGNALIHEGEGGSLTIQAERAHEFAETIADLVEDGWTPIITHGNGPQVGFILRRGELAASDALVEKLPDLPLWLAVADSQGGIGHIITVALNAVMRRRNLTNPVAAVLTHTVVDVDDAAFSHPTKPIGGWLDSSTAMRHVVDDGWDVSEVEPGSYRRVVPSPEPLEVVELDAIRVLVKASAVVVAAGGGGIPVVLRDHDLVPVDAVIDKDRVSALLAAQLRTSALVIVTGVDRVCIDFHGPNEAALDLITVAEAAAFHEAGHFPAGSMGPKIESAIAFVNKCGSDAVITSIGLVREALHGLAGTRIVAGFDDL
ncbi:MAG: carbamate kinase [Candidatus Nanopelagicales bacterium]